MKKQYMNIETGSIDDYNGWYYENENGETVNAVDRGEVTPVEIEIDVDADFTNRVLGNRDFHEASEGDEYDAEFSAEGRIKSTNQPVVITWMHTFVKGQEPEDLSSLDWDSPKRVALAV